MLFLLPLGLVAQEIKIATVNTNEIMTLMPDFSAFETEMANIGQQYQKEAKSMEDEYVRKYSDLTAQADSLTDNIKQLRMQEIQDIQARLDNFVASAQESMEKKRNELLAPIYEKVQKAIDAVGEENGYMCILLPQALLYRGKGIIDATAQVKTKLGLK